MSTGLIRVGEPFADPREREGGIRNAWIWQLSLAAVVAIVTVFTSVIAPQVLVIPALLAGSIGLFATTIAALALPWRRMPMDAVAVLPYLDIVWVGLLTFSTDLRLSHLWVFPITWLAALFSLGRLVLGLGLVGLIALIEVVVNDSPVEAALRVLIAVLALAFVGSTVHLTARQGRAYRTLLRRQVRRIHHTLDTVSIEQRRVSETLDGVHIGIARISRTGTLISANSAYRSLYALNEFDSAPPGRAVEYDGFRGTALRADDRTYARAARGEEFDAEQVWLFGPDGSWHALSVTSRRQTPRSGEEPSTVLLVEDITEVLAAHRRRDDLAAIVSHELRNPLTGILGNTDRLLERDDLDDDARDRLRVIESAGERMMHLITSILSTPQHGPASLERDARALTEVRGIAEASVDSFAASAHEHVVTISLAPGPPVQAWADAFRLRQMLDNLIGNAVKYTPAGGAVTVSVRRAGPDVEIAVTDTGIGIPADDLPRIFEHSFRSSQVVDSGIPGTGLGLRIVHDIVTSHGGTIDIDSEVGMGTTVTVRIPTEAA
ncbi:sensor histidine kinase [Microbacterium sp.]|uniref:sensor histidine kinase n=1 Tax=Microbacterium sp. TaxID=51671 RepID=UPI0037C5C6B5